MTIAYRVPREKIEPIAHLYTKAELGRMLDVSQETIARSCERYGLTCKAFYKIDYTQIDKLANDHHISEIARILGISPSTVSRRLSRLGIKACREPKGARAKHSPQQKRPQQLVTKFKAGPVTDFKPKTYSDLAAEHVQKDRVVFKCDEDGRPNPKGAFYMCGRSVKTPEETIALARRLRWQPEAWMQVAA